MGKHFCEATRDLFLGCGMTPELARYTKPSEFKERNELGKLLNEIASDIGTQYFTKSTSHSFECEQHHYDLKH